MNNSLIWEQFDDLNKIFPDFVLTPEENKYFIRGNIHFRVQYSTNEPIEDVFFIEIELSNSYPSSPPVARDLGERIPRSFHTFEDGIFCLGAPLAVKMTFFNNPTLLGFVNSLLIPYLYSFSYQEANQGRMPFGELAHGGNGLMDYYMRLFEIKQQAAVIDFLVILAYQRYRGHLLCPCRSGNNLRRCHGPLLLELKKHQTPEEFYVDLHSCYSYYKNFIKEQKAHV